MRMTLDEIMRREKFNDVEKALVNDPMLSQPDRIKVICEIRTRQINEIQSDNMTILTMWLATLGLLSFVAQVLDDSDLDPQRLLVAALILWVISPLILMGKTWSKKVTDFVRRFWRSVSSRWG